MSFFRKEIHACMYLNMMYVCPYLNTYIHRCTYSESLITSTYNAAIHASNMGHLESAHVLLIRVLSLPVFLHEQVFYVGNCIPIQLVIWSHAYMYKLDQHFRRHADKFCSKSEQWIQ